MTIPRTMLAAWALLGAASLAAAQAPAEKKDDALDRLLEKVDTPKDKDKPAAEGDKPKDKPAPAEDSALDSLLEKIGGEAKTPDAPRTKPEAPTVAPRPKADAKPEDLKGQEKALDDDLETIQGKIRRKKPPQGEPQGPGQGQDQPEPPGKLGEAVKKMRIVEEKLGRDQTGKETREKQQEIVKDLETLLKQMRKSQQMAQAKKQQRGVKQAGLPKDQQGPQQPQDGQNAQGAPPMDPGKPTTIKAAVGDKSPWGNLPPEMRAELDNIAKEMPLERRKELIERYYLSVSKKERARRN